MNVVKDCKHLMALGEKGYDVGGSRDKCLRSPCSSVSEQRMEVLGGFGGLVGEARLGKDFGVIWCTVMVLVGYMEGDCVCVYDELAI